MEMVLQNVLELNSKLEVLINQNKPAPNNEWLTPDEVSQILKVDKSTVHNWTKKGKLKKYAIGNRVYYKRDEVEAALIKL